MKTFFALVKFFLYFLKQNKALKLVLSVEKQGDIPRRDKLIFSFAQTWAQYVVALSGKNTIIHVSGEKNIPQQRAVVFVANHQSYFDIPVMLGYIPKSFAFIAKSEIKKMPFLPEWMRLLQCVFIERKNHRQSLRAMAQAIENVKNGYSLVIFPEGTRSKTGDISDFKAGSFKLAIKSQAPIVPVSILGTRNLFEKKRKLCSGEIFLTIHPPIFTEHVSKEEAGELPKKVHDIIASALIVPIA